MPKWGNFREQNSPHPSPPFKVGKSVIFYNNNIGTTLQEGVEEGKLYMYFPLFKLAKHQRGTLGQSVSANYVADSSKELFKD